MTQKRKPAARTARKPRKQAKPQARARTTQLDRELEERANVPGRAFQALKRPANARFEAFVSEDNARAEIDIYDVIGSYECNAAGLRQMLNQISASTITVNINSPGGSVFDGMAMYADLRAHSARIIVRVTGLAASAASVIAMAGDEIEIAENGFLMIHNSWSIAMGDKEDFRKMAKTLGQIDTRMVKTYAQRTGADADQITEWMDAETWMDSDDAVEFGFADRVTEAADASALAHDVTPFANAPDALRRARAAAPRTQAPEPAEVDTQADTLAAAVEALNGLSDAIAAAAR